MALLAMLVELVMSALTYIYVRERDLGRMISGIWDLPLGHPSPVIPFLLVLTGALFVGPISGSIGRPVRKVIQGS